MRVMRHFKKEFRRLRAVPFDMFQPSDLTIGRFYTRPRRNVPKRCSAYRICLLYAHALRLVAIKAPAKVSAGLPDRFLEVLPAALRRLDLHS